MRTLMLSAVLTLILIAPAQAITAKEYTDDVDPDIRYAYLEGALQMAVSMYNAEKRPDKADCAWNWFIENTTEANAALWEAMRSPAVQDYPAAVAIRFVIDKKCDE